MVERIRTERNNTVPQARMSLANFLTNIRGGERGDVSLGLGISSGGVAAVLAILIMGNVGLFNEKNYLLKERLQLQVQMIKVDPTKVPCEQYTEAVSEAKREKSNDLNWLVGEAVRRGCEAEISRLIRSD